MQPAAIARRLSSSQCAFSEGFALSRVKEQQQMAYRIMAAAHSLQVIVWKERGNEQQVLADCLHPVAEAGSQMA